MKVEKFCLILIGCLFFVLTMSNLVGAESTVKTPTTFNVKTSPFQARIFADWQRQESHFKRTVAAPAALTDLNNRLNQLIATLEENELIEETLLQTLRTKLAETKKLDLLKLNDEQRTAAYCDLRWLARQIIFSNELVKETPLIFIKGQYFGFEVMHEYLSYYARYTNLHGGGIFILNQPGKSFQTTSLTGDFPRGQFSTINLSYDGKVAYFSFADFSKVQNPKAPRGSAITLFAKGNATHILDYLKEPEGKYHLYKMDLATGKTEQLTDGPWDDYDPVPTPDGDLIFVSIRRGGFARCNGGQEPISVGTLHKLKKDGSIQCISWHETNEWTPVFLHDGRVAYSRWDYVDRSASRYQGLWLTNPDGTGATSLFGNYTEDICVCIQPEPIPNSKKIMFLAAAHHLGVGGSLVILDPSKVSYNTKNGMDLFDAVERISPEIPFPETDVVPFEDKFRKPQADDKYNIPQQYYFSPHPLSEDFYFVSYSHDPLGGYLPTHGALTEETLVSGKLGLYYRDRFGNLELMYEDDQYDCRYPIPLQKRDVPVQIPSQLSSMETETGTFSLVDVYESLLPLPADRKIKELRIYQILPKYPTHAGHNPPIGHDFAGNARALLGTVPVEEDGSAYFTAPAKKPLYFQAVDEQGRAVQTMLSEAYLQPGENRGCVGCHEQAQTTADNKKSNRRIALNRAPSKIVPGPAGTKPFCYPLLVQPILDRSCTSCHSGKEGSSRPPLTGELRGAFTVSYNNLQPYLRWYEWLTATIRRTVSFPGECGADMSRLSAVLEDGNHKNKIKLNETDRRTLYMWLDSNIPFYGVYENESRQKQLRGEEVPMPKLQ